MVRKAWPFWLGGIAIAWLFDFLFWQKAPGISTLIWVILLILVGGGLLLHERVKPSWLNILLMIAATGMALVMVLRSEPFTSFLAFCLILTALFTLTFSYQKATWIFYRVRDFVTAFVLMLIGMFGKGTQLIRSQKHIEGGDKAETGQTKKPVRLIGSVLLGILIAIPILAILTMLLGSADLAFAHQLKTIAESLRLEHLPENISRAGYILVLAYLVVGLWLHTGFPSKPEIIPSDENNKVKPFLGWTETAIILVSVDLLFLFFVGLQFRYLFGAQANISVEGFTYAEYARRGFFELLAVTLFSLLIDLVLSAIAKREGKAQKGWFTGLRLGLLGLLCVILASALQRLILYENAYGFSRLRTYAHLFIFWLAGLILALIVFEVIRKQRFFMVALLVTVFGFGISLAAINIDGLIVSENVQRVKTGVEFDSAYLNQLSSDAVPEMVKAFRSQETPLMIKDALGVDLACRLHILSNASPIPWQSFHISSSIADNLIVNLKYELTKYPVTKVNGSPSVSIGGVLHPCY